jgi:hypothetical protein
MPDALPDWPDGTVAVLSTGAGAPHAIPVSTAVRLGPCTVALALALGRESLARLREEPRCALTLLAGDVSVTLHGQATIEPLRENLAAVRIAVELIQDHGDTRFAIDAGVLWRWTDPKAAARDTAVRAALRGLAP